MTQIPSDDRAVRSQLKAPGLSWSLHIPARLLLSRAHPLSLCPSVPRSGSPQAGNSKPVHLGWQMTALESLHLKEKCANFTEQQHFSTAPWQDSSQGGETRDSGISPQWCCRAPPPACEWECVQTEGTAGKKGIWKASSLPNTEANKPMPCAQLLRLSLLLSWLAEPEWSPRFVLSTALLKTTQIRPKLPAHSLLLPATHRKHQ